MTTDLQNTLLTTFNLPLVGSVAVPTLLEWMGAAVGLISVVGNLRFERWGWLAQAVSSVVYLAVFYLQGLFGLAALQIYFTLVAVWAWWQWAKSREENSARVLQLTPKLTWILGLIWMVSTGGLGLVLQAAGEASSAYIDAFVTTGSILAQGLMVKHFRNTWHVWLIVNIISVGLFAKSQLWATTLLYAVFAALALAGLKSWKK
jgi:nicotinamide mononucleotide transporter